MVNGVRCYTVPTTGAAYPNNQIPSSEWSPAFQKPMQWWPVPNASGFVVVPSTYSDNEGYYVLRADVDISLRNTLYGDFLVQRAVQAVPLLDHDLATSQNGSQLNSWRGDLTYNFVATPRLLINNNISINNSPGYRTLDAPWGNVRNFGIAINSLATELDVSLNNYSIGSASRAAAFRRGDVVFANSERYIKGRHSVLFRAEVDDDRYNEYNPYHGSGVFNFNGQCTGFDAADALIGCMSSFTQGIGEYEFRRYHYQGFYGADTFRISPNLTLDLGLRWEPFTPITDLGHRNLQFNENAYLAGEHSQLYVNSPPGLFYPRDKLNGQTISLGATADSLDLLASRVGLAYDPKGDGRTSIRSGFGVYYDSPEIYMLNALSDQAPFGYDENLIGGDFDNPYAGREQYNVFPLSAGFLKNPDLPFQLPLFAYAEEATFPQATTYEYNFSVEHELGQSWLMRIAYVGSASSHLFESHDINAPIYNFSETLDQNLLTINQRRPRPQYQQLYILGTGYNANYNSLQLSVDKRLSHGLTLTSNYVWSKAIDYESTNGSIEDQRGIQTDPFDMFYLTRGLSDFNHTDSWVTSYVYSLPSPGVGGGQPRAVGPGWQVFDIILYRTGLTFYAVSHICHDKHPPRAAYGVGVRGPPFIYWIFAI